MERFEIQKAFTELKPLCDSLMKNPSIGAARNVAQTVTNISDKIIQDLLEYILFPLMTHLKNEHVSKNVKEELIRAMKVIISKARITKLEYFNNLYASLLYQIYDKSQKNMVIPDHEELKEAVLSCIITLIHSCFTEVIDSLYTRVNAPKIGQGILLSITIARTEKSRILRLIAIETVMALCQVDDKADRSDITLQDQVADVIMLYLPGIASGLQEVALGNEIQGHKVTLMALQAWSRVIALVMHDKAENENTPSLDTLSHINKTESNDPLGISLRLKDRDDIEKLLKSASRNQEWFDAAATKLNILVRELDALRKHSHYKVRRELAQSIHLLLTTCSRNMKPNIMLLIEYLISLSEDEVSEVNEEAKKALDEVSRNYMQSRNMRPLIELLEENFYNLLSKLPRIIRMSDDNEQLSCLNQVSGYLKLLGAQRLPRIIMSTSHLRRLLLSLVYISEIDCSDISLLQNANVKDLDDPAQLYGSHLWRRFKYIQNHSCEEKVVAICKSLGELGDLRTLVDSILELMVDAPQHRKELICLLNWITNVPLKDSYFLSFYKEIVEFYINPEIWYTVIEVTEDIPLRIAQSNVVQCCLLLEGLGLIAQNLQHHYERFLLKTLYLVIERAGSWHSLISFVGTETLEQMSIALKYKSIGDLLRANVDYFSYHVTIKLRRVDRNPGVLDVVGLVMKYSTLDVLPYLKTIVQDALSQLNHNFQERNVYAFLKVFYIFVICIKNMVNPKNPDLSEQDCMNEKCKSERIIEYLLEYYEAKKVNDKIEEEPIFTEAEIEKEITEMSADYASDLNPEFEEGLEDKDPEPPPYIKMIEDVIKHCLHFLPSKEVQRSLIAMTTLQEGLIILTDWENQLLPIVHLLWHPLVDRFHDENVLVINRAWQLLNVIACVAKDFIRSRTLKQVLPAISKFLSNSAKESYHKNSANAYKFTQIFKLQKELLSTLGRISRNLCLQEKDLWDILSIAEPYLNSQQNPVLQACCVQLYKDIADYNEDIAWVKCLGIWNSKITKIPSSIETFTMDNLKISADNSRNDYYKNVEIILKYIRDKSQLP